MPRVAELPSGWRHFSSMQKIEHLIGLDRSYEILSWSPDAFDPVRLSMKSQVIRIILSICTKAMLEGKLSRCYSRAQPRFGPQRTSQLLRAPAG